MPHQRARKKKKKRERSQGHPEQDQQMILEEKAGFQETEESPQKIKIRKRREKTRTERLIVKASKHTKVILVSIIWFLVVIYVIYRLVSSDSLPGGP